MNENPCEGAGTAQPLPWDQQAGETARQFEAFRRYRNRTPAERSLAKVGQELGVSTSYLERLSSELQWMQRVAAWDHEQDLLDRARSVRERQEMNAMQAAVAAAAIRKLAEAVDRIDIGKLKPLEIARLLDVAGKTERLARGLVCPADTSGEQRSALPNADAIRLHLQAVGLLRPDKSEDIPSLVPLADRPDK
jgi:hypothetical protein